MGQDLPEHQNTALTRLHSIPMILLLLVVSCILSKCRISLALR